MTPPKLLRNLRGLKYGARHSATATVLPMDLNPAAPPPPEPRATPPDSEINFTDSKQLFSSLSTLKLAKSLATLQMAAFEPVVDVGSWVMKSKLIKLPISREVVLGVTERTFYDHFVAGKDLTAANATARKLSESGLTAMLDYGLEGADDNDSCDSSVEMFIQTIDSAKSTYSSSVSFVVIKVTAICPSKLLKRVSDLLRWEYKDSSLKLPWKLKTLPLLCDSSPFYHTLTKPEALTPEEERDLELAFSRMFRICQKSFEANLPLLIDAEDTDIQPAIDYFTYSAAFKFHSALNQGPLIYNTIQAYLKDSKDRLVIAKKAADAMGIPLGIKLVRGAYISNEKKIAAKAGADSPIHDSIQNTHACYDECAEFMLNEISSGSGSLVLATHNIESEDLMRFCPAGKLAAKKAVDLGIEKDSENLRFAQLYGMAEALSFGLRNAGFNVSKYVPFGPVEKIIPYLVRRAEENKGMLSASSIDRVLMRKELIRRLLYPGT